MEVLDIGRLIECIHERTFLWDEKNNHYRDIKARDMAWTEIGDEMFADWAQLSRTEKAEREKLMKIKWKHLKFSLRRSIRHGQASIYSESLFFLHDNFQRSSSLTQKKKVTVENQVQNDGCEANENSSSDSFQNTNGLGNTQPSLSQKNSDCSSSDSIQNTHEQRNEQPSSSRRTINISSSDFIQNTPEQRNVQPSLSQGTSDCRVSNSIQNRNRLRNVLPSLAQKKRKRVKPSPKQEKAPDKSFLVDLLQNYGELNEEEKLDFQNMSLQYIQKARKKRNLQTYSDPMQITPD